MLNKRTETSHRMRRINRTRPNHQLNLMGLYRRSTFGGANARVREVKTNSWRANSLAHHTDMQFCSTKPIRLKHSPLAWRWVITSAVYLIALPDGSWYKNFGGLWEKYKVQVQLLHLRICRLRFDIWSRVPTSSHLKKNKQKNTSAKSKRNGEDDHFASYDD